MMAVSGVLSIDINEMKIGEPVAASLLGRGQSN